MTYFEDETPYSFAPSQGEGVVLNVGWLDGSRTYVQGAVPSDFVGRLRDLCASGTTRTRGWHRCNVCPDGAPYPTAVERADTERYLVGDAEIRVVGQASVIYAAPTMVIHGSPNGATSGGERGMLRSQMMRATVMAVAATAALVRNRP